MPETTANNKQGCDKPDVVFVVIDALRWDVLKWAIESDMVPNLKKLQEFGSYKENHFTVSSPTQFSFSSLLSSRMPLDDRGYEDGVASRPEVVSEFFKNNGYETYGFTSCTDISPYHGYDRGFDEFHFNCDPKVFARRYTVEIERVQALKEEGSISASEVDRIILEKTERFVSSSEKYVYAVRKGDGSLKVGVNDEAEFSSFLDALDRYKEKCNSEGNTVGACWFLSDALSSIASSSHSSPGKSPVFFRAKWLVATSIRLVSCLSLRFPSRSAKAVYRWIKNSRFSDKAINKTASVLNDQVTKIFSRIRQRPRFLFIHYYDVHDKRVYNFLENTLRWRIPERNSQVPSFLLVNPGYLMGLVNLDHEIGVLSSLVKINDKRTYVVLTSDHGMPMEGITDFKPKRRYKDFSVANAYFDEVYNVPFYLGCFGGGTDGFDSEGISRSIDVIPTMVDIAGIEISVNFKGRSMLRQKATGNSFLLAENMGRGAAFFGIKPVTVMVRDSSVKVVCEFYPGKSLLSYAVSDVYYLIPDPGEKRNLTADVKKNPSVRKLIAKACCRARFLRGQEKL